MCLAVSSGNFYCQSSQVGATGVVQEESLQAQSKHDATCLPHFLWQWS